MLAHGHHEEKKQPTPIEAEKQAETISPVASRTPQVRRNLKLKVPPPRRSRGIGIQTRNPKNRSTFLDDRCYESANSYAGCIEFHIDKHHRRGFNASQLIDYTLEPNSDAGDGQDAPPQKLSLAFSTADVVVLGWRLGLLADKLRENKLAAIGVLPKRYAQLERIAVFVSSIVITPIAKSSG